MVLTQGLGVGRNKKKTVGIGCSEFTDVKKLLSLQKIAEGRHYKAFIHKGREKKILRNFGCGGFELGFQVVCIW